MTPSSYEVVTAQVVRAFTRRYNLTLAEADDLHGDVVLHLAKVAQGTDAASLMENPKYLRTVVLNAALEHIRSLIRHRRHLVVLDDYNTMPTEAVDPDDAIFLSEALGQLSEGQLKVVGVYYGLNGFPATRKFESIAKITGFSRQQCKQLYQAAMTILRRAAK